MIKYSRHGGKSKPPLHDTTDDNGGHVRFIICMLVVFMLYISGCAVNHSGVVRKEDYPQTKKIFDIQFGWKKTITTTGIEMEGYAQNIRYPVVNDLELRLELLDKARRVRARTVYYFIPDTLMLDDISSFSVKIPLVPQKGDLLRFVYRYQAAEDRDEAFSWMNSFEVPAMEGK